MKKRFQWPVTPQAHPDNIVTYKNWRFTVLTDRLIRMEYDPECIFEDRASQTAFHRDFPKVDFKVRTDDAFSLETAHLHVRCNNTLESLEVSLCNWPHSWHYGDSIETLGGTTSTLDRVDGRIGVEDGICSQLGFAVLDDSERMILNDGWADVRRKGTRDFYFFGYKHDYIGADLRNRNTDVLDQAVEILKRSQTGMEFKNAVYKKMLECNPITEYELYITSRSPEERATVAAVLELYLLERECLR